MLTCLFDISSGDRRRSLRVDTGLGCAPLKQERLFMLQACHSPPIVGIGARGGAVVLGTTLQGRRLRVRFPMASLEFFIDIFLPVAL